MHTVRRRHALRVPKVKKIKEEIPMKNLKKVLALGLALVMVLGMFTVASAAETKKVATDLTDWDSVKNKDAVSLMVDLEVINGMPDGSYSPAKTIDRASWAKMLYFVLTGEQDASMYESDYPALKDITTGTGKWAQGYIEYLYTYKYVSGDNYGNYNPTQSLTVAAAAKTMLTGLGYDSKIEGYEGSNWSNNVIAAAKKNGLLKGISQKQDENITRDNAAQMVYNALEAQTVTPETTLNMVTGEYVPSGKYEKGETLGYKSFDIVKVEGKVNGVNKDGKATFDGALTVVNKTDSASITGAVTGTIPATAANVGTTAAFFVKASDVTFNNEGKITAAKLGDVVSTRLAGSSNAVLKTINDGVKFTTDGAKVWDSKDKAYVGYEADDKGVTYYKDGVTASAEDVASGNKVDLVDANNDGKVDIVRITTYKVKVLSDDPTTKTKDDKTTVTVKFEGSTDSLTGVDAAKVNGYAGLAKGDVVLYSETKAAGETSPVAYTLEKLTKAVTGKVASYKGTTLRVNGTDYDVSGVQNGVDDEMTDLTAGKTEYDFFLGKDGKICYVAAVGEEASKDLVLVMDVTKDTTGAGFNKENIISAKVMFVDGDIETVTLASVKYNSTDPKAEGDAIIGNSNTKFQASDDTTSHVNDNIALGFFTYKVDKDGKYELTADSENLRSLTASNVALKGTNKIDGSLEGNNSTVYIVEVGESAGHKDATRKVYTGFKNAPKLDNTDDASNVTVAVAYGKSGEAAKYVFISAKALAGTETKDMIFVPDETDIYTDNVNECQVLVAYNDKGEKVEIKIADDATVSAAGFYQVKSVNDKDICTLGTVISVDSVAVSAKLDGGALTLGTYFVAFDDATELKMITLDEEGKKVESYTTGKVDGSFKSGEEAGELTYVAILGDGTAPTKDITEAVDVVYVIARPIAETPTP